MLGLILRAQSLEMSSRIEYSLADIGRSLVPIIQSLAGWCKTLDVWKDGEGKYFSKVGLLPLQWEPRGPALGTYGISAKESCQGSSCYDCFI